MALHVALPLALLGCLIYAFLFFPTDAEFPYFLFFPLLFLAIFALVFVVRRHAAVPLGWRMGPRARKDAFVVAAVTVAALAGLYGWAGWRAGTNRDVARAAANGFAGDASPVLFDATVAMEDGLFYQHRGFDFEAMHRALRVNLRSGRVRQGGSTITQQLAKNLFLVKDRTLQRKILEFPLTMELERRLTKAQILALYVHSIDYGMGQHGIANAARFYFGTTPSKLTLGESALLVGMVPHAPKTLPPDGTLVVWRGRALERIGYQFSDRYPAAAIDAAAASPIPPLPFSVKAPLPPTSGGF